MGCTLSSGDGAEGGGSADDVARNALISQEMSRDKRKHADGLRLLLLGAGDSGKTTIFKQLRILYGEGFTEAKLAGMRMAVHNNLVLGAQAVAQASLDGVAGRPLTGEARRLGELVLTVEENTELTAEIAGAVARLWEDADFRATWDARSAYQVLDGWADFAEQSRDFPAWGGPEWVPSVQDAVRARVRTSGIVEEKFDMDGVKLTLIDVGGQRNERRKWMHCFEGVTAVIFVVAMSEYDQTLFEARDKNRLEEALELFEQVCKMQWFRRTNVVLFLNKSDLFRHKLCEQRIPLNVSGLFPDAPEAFDFDQGSDWLRSKFSSRCTVPGKKIFTHVTCATDTYNVRVVFDACKSYILRDSLEQSGLLTSAE